MVSMENLRRDLLLETIAIGVIKNLSSTESSGLFDGSNVMKPMILGASLKGYALKLKSLQASYTLMLFLIGMV